MLLARLRHPLTRSFYAPAFLFALSEALLTPILPVYAGQFGASYVLIGLLLSAEALGTLMANVPAGLALRRLGLRRVMLLGVAVVGLATAALYMPPIIYVAIACRLIGGFGVALFAVSQHTYMAMTIVTVQRGRALALYGGITRVGILIGPALGGLVGAALGLRFAFLLSALVFMASFTLLFLWLHPNESDMKTISQHTGHRAGRRLWTVVRDYRAIFVTAGIGQLLAQMVRVSRRVIIPLYAADVLGLDVQMIGILVSVAAVVDAMMFYVAGWLMDTRGRKYAIIPSFALQGIGMALVPLTGDFWGLLLVTALINLGNGIGSGTMLTLGTDFAPPNARGEFLGVWQLIGNTGSAGAPLIVGGVADLLVLPAAALVMALVGLAAAGVFAFFVPETLQKPEPSVTPT